MIRIYLLCKSALCYLTLVIKHMCLFGLAYDFASSGMRIVYDFTEESADHRIGGKRRIIVREVQRAVSVDRVRETVLLTEIKIPQIL